MTEHKDISKISGQSSGRIWPDMSDDRTLFRPLFYVLWLCFISWNVSCFCTTMKIVQVLLALKIFHFFFCAYQEILSSVLLVYTTSPILNIHLVYVYITLQIKFNSLFRLFPFPTGKILKVERNGSCWIGGRSKSTDKTEVQLSIWYSILTAILDVKQRKQMLYMPSLWVRDWILGD